jgi:exportin-T
MLANGHGATLPGFEQFVYERVVPLAFQVASSPSFNLKDGQTLLVNTPRILS